MTAHTDMDVKRLALQVVELTAELHGLRTEVADLSAAVLPDDFEVPEADAPAPPSEPAFESLKAWVTGYFLPTFHRPIGGEIRWCIAWEQHAEALLRLEALWRSWEALRLDPNLGMATWLTNYLDPIMSSLMARSGTFAQCAHDRHRP